MHRLTWIACTAGLLVATPWLAEEARAEGALLGPRLFIETDDGSDAVIGVELRTELGPLGRNAHIDLRPSFDYYVFDDADGFDFDVYGLGVDALFSFQVGTNAELYGIAGLSVFILSVETPAGDDSDTDVGVNLGFGARFLTRGNVQPFLELRATIGDVEPVLIGGGILFAL
ncbi:MAG: porin family protein [Kofleriaceae bacterium]|nr:MAG: porin family protein [Kofleriaceae bacterium]MBZ0237447.1 porin family protein [Kofleriaceae bacterium]